MWPRKACLVVERDQNFDLSERLADHVYSMLIGYEVVARSLISDLGVKEIYLQESSKLGTFSYKAA